MDQIEANNFLAQLNFQYTALQNFVNTHGNQIANNTLSIANEQLLTNLVTASFPVPDNINLDPNVRHIVVTTLNQRFDNLLPHAIVQNYAPLLHISILYDIYQIDHMQNEIDQFMANVNDDDDDDDYSENEEEM
jgi:hypothetical protein